MLANIIMLTTSVEAICLNYRPKKDNTYPIMLRLTKSGKRKYVSLGVSVKEEHWDFKKNTPKRNCPDRDFILSIIEKYRKKDAAPEDYIFPILDRKVHKTETQIRDKVRKANKATNKALHKIEDKLGLPISLTTYVVRHSFATVLKRSGVSISVISESLGHKLSTA